jgi:hypothetical protein
VTTYKYLRKKRKTDNHSAIPAGALAMAAYLTFVGLEVSDGEPTTKKLAAGKAG